MASKSKSHRSRLENCLSGEVPDRTPIALWRHFPVDDQTPGGLASATAAFQWAYDFDLIKVTPASSFCLKDWGAKDQWRGNTEGTRDYSEVPVHMPEDWEKLAVLDPYQGYLGNQLTCLGLLVKEFTQDTPILQTIFSPLAQAKNLIGADNLILHLRTHPDALHLGLKTITASTIQFIEAAAKTGIAGVFYAIQQAQFGLLSVEEFDEFGRHYDLQVLGAAQSLWLNMLHLHGENVMFDQVADYPAPVINWHDRHTTPGLGEAQKRFNGVVCGGISRRETMVLGTAQDVKEECLDAIDTTGGQRLILGTGCVLPIIAPHGNILAARQSVERGFAF
jgi:uroporphyrinogen decarboxylase